MNKKELFIFLFSKIILIPIIGTFFLFPFNDGLSIEDLIRLPNGDVSEYRSGRAGIKSDLYSSIDNEMQWKIVPPGNSLSTMPFMLSPVLGNIEASSIEYREEDPEIIITNSITISNTSLTINTIDLASIFFTSGYTLGEDTLIFTDQLGITGSFDPVRGMLSLSGSAHQTNYETALRIYYL